MNGDYVDHGLFLNWKVKARDLISKVCGKESEHYKEFEKQEKAYVGATNYSILLNLKPIFFAVKEDYEKGHLNPTGNMITGRHIFIGHGRSLIWLNLKDFLQERLGLTVDEFNRVPTAGVTTPDRLKEMLNDAAFAFLILTAEDEQADGKVHARLNVVHEAGLFQGKLGFKRAIIMLEEGCEEFSNVHGLGQLRFPAGMIGSQFEEIRRVLERENIST